MGTIETTIWQSPVGDLIIGSWNGKLCMCDWLHRRDRARVDARVQHALGASFKNSCSEIATSAIWQLEEYFAGGRKDFSIPLLTCGTSFQRAVWDALTTIPYGHTVTYRDVALHIGRETATRAVASAIGANPLSVFIPCHRVIGANGSLTGYAGSLATKEALLSLEKESKLPI